MLPELDQVQYAAWVLTKACEADFWTEARAMKRAGWSETHWRTWLRQLALERDTRLDWECDLRSWSLKRWDGWMGRLDGRNRTSQAVYSAMLDEEAERRLHWIKWMRSQGWGEEDWTAWYTKWHVSWRVYLSDGSPMCLGSGLGIYSSGSTVGSSSDSSSSP